MTARNFLVRGLVVGLLAGFAAFLVAYTVGEPQVDTAIALEEATSAAEPPAEGDEDGADHGGTTEVSRAHQSTWGLLTGTLAVGTVLGGFVALVSAATVGRLGRLDAVQSTAAVAVIGFVSYSLVPFLKYPATPPAVGSADTIGSRTTSYFALVLVSVVLAIAAVAAARALAPRVGGLRASVAALLGYAAVVGLVAALMPTVNEIGSFPADTLWSFRLSSLATLAVMWAVIGIGLVLVVDRMSSVEQAHAARRQLAASL